MADTVLTELKIHDFDTLEQHLQHESGIGDNDIVFTPDMSAKLFLFKHAWADYLVSDTSWLRADTFSWHSGDKYVAAYEHLLSDYNSSTLQTETIGDITITYYLAQDGHKICLPDQESNIVALYEATGVAWYYILDTANKQFKLPRTKWGFTGLRDSVGGYVEPALPNITGKAWARGPEANFNGSEGALYVTATADAYGQGHVEGKATAQFNLDASRSSTIYKDGATVQPPATQMYLYFYVGNFEQSAVEQTAGLNAELFNNKADRELGNIPTNYDYVVESQLPTADNGYTWYRKYKSGWVEQGGTMSYANAEQIKTIVLPIEMANSNYTLQLTRKDGSAASADTGYRMQQYNSKTTTGFSFWWSINDRQSGIDWQVSGISAE